MIKAWQVEARVDAVIDLVVEAATEEEAISKARAEFANDLMIIEFKEITAVLEYPGD